MIYGTQEVIRACVKPGMVVKHQGKTWTASANTGGKLYLYSLTESKRISDIFIEVCLDSRGNPQIQ
ncbi:cell division inhibitor protein [Escherichia coli]|uniref:cell division inhibitor protein n=1 Tax=Escherichia coli TaxID=562 RepID=UPI0010EC93E6|nr:cell division inhibitor protein [Escherichia coli]EJF8031386.1 cell division inhibitor protein [Escherichia coli]MDF1396571.1 cell division inhibitor protein [Escherichia coli]GDF32135.1 phage cell division inhibitor protein [Escherichia coli]HAL6342317.1 cell division inhibitor protein [Escherichia coli]HAX4872292.1 cell division inhibitor protein [Escherichia coli]